MGLMNSLRGEGTSKYRGDLRKLIGQERESDRMFGDVTQEQLTKGLQARIGGYDQAIERSSDVSRAARRGVLQRGKQLESDLTARMGAGGKFGTTALDAARIGLHSALSSDLENIDAGFADLFSSLAVGRGETEAAGRSALGAFAQDRSSQESELYRLLAGTVKTPKAGMLGGLLSAGGAALGTMFGGPVGGAFGGELGSAVGSGLERD
jgi:hypothetical protein